MTVTFDVLGFMGRSQSGKDLSGQYLADKYNFVRIGLADVLKRFTHAVFPLFDRTTHLWGASHFRNEAVAVDWQESRSLLVNSLDGWVNSLALSIQEKASYRNIVRSWFEACKEHAESRLDGKLSARVALQLLGTEYGRSFKDGIWVDYFFEIAEAVKKGASYHPYYGTAGGGVRSNGIIITDLRFINELAAVKQRGGHVIRLIRLSQEGQQSGADQAGLPQHQSELELQSIPFEEFNVVLRMEEGEEFVTERLDKMMKEREWETS